MESYQEPLEPSEVSMNMADLWNACRKDPRNKPNINEASLFFKNTESKENCILKIVTSKPKQVSQY